MDMASGVTIMYKPPGSGGAVSAVPVPAVLPEAGIVLAIISIPFIAACCMAGVQKSTGSKGTIGSVVGTVAIVGVVAGVIGLCAFKAGTNIPTVGPAASALTPLTATYSSI